MDAFSVLERCRKELSRKGYTVVPKGWSTVVVKALKEFLDHIEEFYSVHENSKGDVLINLILWDGEEN